MLRRLLGALVLLGCGLFAVLWLSAFLPALPWYSWPLALCLWLALRRRRAGTTSLGSERQTTTGGDA